MAIDDRAASLQRYQTGQEPIFLAQHPSVQLGRMAEERARAAAAAAAECARRRLYGGDEDRTDGTSTDADVTCEGCSEPGSTCSEDGGAAAAAAGAWSRASSLRVSASATASMSPARPASSSRGPGRTDSKSGLLSAAAAALHPVDWWRPYLPSWDISRSRVWAMAEAAVAQHLTARPEHLPAHTGRPTAPAAIVAISKAATKAALDNATAAAATAAAITVAGAIAGGGGTAPDAAQVQPAASTPHVALVRTLADFPTGVVMQAPSTPGSRGSSRAAGAGPGSHGGTAASTPFGYAFPGGLLESEGSVAGAPGLPATPLAGFAPSPRNARPGVLWAPLPAKDNSSTPTPLAGCRSAAYATPDTGCKAVPPTPAGMGPRALSLVPFRSFRVLDAASLQPSGANVTGSAAATGGTDGIIVAGRITVATAAYASPKQSLPSNVNGSGDARGALGRVSSSFARRSAAGASEADGPLLNTEGSLAGVIAHTLTDLLLGPHASACTRHHTQKRVRAVLAGASVAWVAVNVFTVAQALGGVDFSHDLPNSTKAILDLLFNWPNFGEVARELAEIGMAVSLGMAQGPAHDSLDETCEAEELWREGLDQGEEARAAAAADVTMESDGPCR
ncbi:hypothetical protein HYH03_006064 [Edaphochlamys debaryana]|uniref:Uncharacterized protein n=1 Tax=Edaphochlamys debaryana TaxID=47281 RepID=A0A835Y4A4_9CHLO|nr:hypothetical protein HYH03_006064 [Edaphochlamys debaryana]|eukprot:KAG2495825.1 hypothetical protein HYH03_006064 [Edaphochlamys debaryana]